MPANSHLQFDLDDATAHLRSVDPVVAALIDKHGRYGVEAREDPYHALLRAILFQQLAGAAANAIQKRFHALYGDRPPAPRELLDTPEDDLRAAGLSRQKLSYMRDLALHVLEGTLDLQHIRDLDDAEVTQQITAVKGLGEWSAHMFLMFHLGRPDVLPVGDLGVRNGMKVAYGLAEAPTPKQAQEIGAKWAPYRSVGSWYMWRAVTAGRPTTPDI
jgi:3-methyladenine DNA glycosylase/8-oxoguanine DNA glycosylase